MKLTLARSDQLDFAPRGNGAIIFGDSIAIGNCVDPASEVAPVAAGECWFVSACMQSNGRMLYKGNRGVASDTTALMVARLATDVLHRTYQPVCVVMGGTNDALNAVALATTVANLTGIVTTLRQAHIFPILCLIPPNNTSTAVRAAISQINQWIAEYGERNGVPVFDAYSPVIDYTGGSYSGTYSDDGLHPNVAGQFLLGTQWNAADGPISHFPQAKPPLMQGGDDTNLIVNGLMQGPVAGIALTWGALGDAVHNTPTDAAGTSGINGFTQVITAVAGNTGYTLQQTHNTPGATTWQVGDRLAFSGRIAATNTTSFVYQVGCTFTGGAASAVYPVYVMTYGISTPETFYLEFVVPAGCTALNFQITSSSGAGVLKVGQLTCVNLTKLGVLG